jgi:hypothetical protein
MFYIENLSCCICVNFFLVLRYFVLCFWTFSSIAYY